MTIDAGDSPRSLDMPPIIFPSPELSADWRLM